MPWSISTGLPICICAGSEGSVTPHSQRPMSVTARWMIFVAAHHSKSARPVSSSATVVGAVRQTVSVHANTPRVVTASMAR